MKNYRVKKQEQEKEMKNIMTKEIMLHVEDDRTSYSTSF